MIADGGVRTELAFDTHDAMAIGTAGYTAMLCVMALQAHGLTPGDGPVLVTGANGGVGTILGSMIGAFTMAVLRNGSGQMGWPTPVQMIIIGCVIIIAVFIDRLRQGRTST